MIPLEQMAWLNEPEWGQQDGALWVRTRSGTDCWQRPHAGISRDNAHALLRPVPPSFRMRGRFRFQPNAQYDQCGLFIRAAAECWFKCSVEFEPGPESRLGSVVTNFGCSDWATQDIPASFTEISFDVSVSDYDIVAGSSVDGIRYQQIRSSRLHTNLPLMAGIYGCSPTGKGFRFEVLELWIES